MTGEAPDMSRPATVYRAFSEALNYAAKRPSQARESVMSGRLGMCHLDVNESCSNMR